MAGREVIEVTVSGPKGSGKTSFILNTLIRAGFSVNIKQDFTEGCLFRLENKNYVNIKEITVNSMSNLRDYETQGGKSSAQIALARLKSMSQQDKIAAEKGVPGFDKVSPEFQEHSVEATLAQRGSRYGDFTDHAMLCQEFKAVAYSFSPVANPDYKPWEHLGAVKQQALEVIFDKIARILSGDPNYDDNWHDIQGYAKLVEDRLPKVTETK